MAKLEGDRTRSPRLLAKILPKTTGRAQFRQIENASHFSLYNNYSLSLYVYTRPSHGECIRNPALLGLPISFRKQNTISLRNNFSFILRDQLVVANCGERVYFEQQILALLLVLQTHNLSRIKLACSHFATS